MAFEKRFYVETAAGSGGRGGYVFTLDSEHDTSTYAFEAADKLIAAGHTVDLVRVVEGYRQVVDEEGVPTVEATTPADEVPAG